MLVPNCLFCLNCTKVGQLILTKIIEIIATRCHILRLKCTKFDFGWAPPQISLASLQRSPRPSTEARAQIKPFDQF